MSQSLLLIINLVWHDIKIVKYWHSFCNKAYKNNFFHYIIFVKWELLSIFFFPEEALVNLVLAVHSYWILYINVNPVSFALLKFPTKCSEGSPLIQKTEFRPKCTFRSWFSYSVVRPWKHFFLSRKYPSKPWKPERQL